MWHLSVFFVCLLLAHTAESRKKKKSFTCRGLLELLTLLLPPFPGLEEAPQGGKLAPTTNGWSVSTREQGLGSHGGQPLYFLSCEETKKKWIKNRVGYRWGCRGGDILVIMRESCRESSRHFFLQRSKQRESVPGGLLNSLVTGWGLKRINKPAYQKASWRKHSEIRPFEAASDWAVGVSLPKHT